MQLTEPGGLGVVIIVVGSPSGSGKGVAIGGRAEIFTILHCEVVGVVQSEVVGVVHCEVVGVVHCEVVGVVPTELMGTVAADEVVVVADPPGTVVNAVSACDVRVDK